LTYWEDKKIYNLSFPNFRNCRNLLPITRQLSVSCASVGHSDSTLYAITYVVHVADYLKIPSSLVVLTDGVITRTIITDDRLEKVIDICACKINLVAVLYETGYISI